MDRLNASTRYHGWLAIFFTLTSGCASSSQEASSRAKIESIDRLAEKLGKNIVLSGRVNQVHFKEGVPILVIADGTRIWIRAKDQSFRPNPGVVVTFRGYLGYIAYNEERATSASLFNIFVLENAVLAGVDAKKSCETEWPGKRGADKEPEGD